jgi:hypothetical protein
MEAIMSEWQEKRQHVLEGIRDALVAKGVVDLEVETSGDRAHFGGRFQIGPDVVPVAIERWGRLPLGSRKSADAPDPRQWSARVGAQGTNPRIFRERKAEGFDFPAIAEEVAKRLDNTRHARLVNEAREVRERDAAAVAARLGVPTGRLDWRSDTGENVVKVVAGSPKRPLVLLLDVAVDEEQAGAVIGVLRRLGLFPAPATTEEGGAS